MPKNKKDLSGVKTEHLEVLHYAGREWNSTGKFLFNKWMCKCLYCGKKFKATAQKVMTQKSCGCQKGIAVSKAQTKHGLSKYHTGRLYHHMIARCHNPKDVGYKNYGGRGIYVCEEWRDPIEGIYKFVEWSKDKWEPGLQIDRIDNDGPYAPWNCRYVTCKINNNRRSNKKVTIEGETLNIYQAIDKFGVVGPNAVRDRLDKGWDIEKALLTKAHAAPIAEYKMPSRNKLIQISVTVNGTQMTMEEALPIYGQLSRQCTKDRLAAGWSAEDALLTPKHCFPISGTNYGFTVQQEKLMKTHSSKQGWRQS